MGETFKISPLLFTKLFTLHIVYMGFFIPVNCALLKDKFSNTYYQMFEVLIRKMATLSLIFNPDSLMLDFESAILHSIRQHFPNATIKGWKFHCTEAVWRKVQFLGLVTHRHSEANHQIVDGSSFRTSHMDTSDLYHHHYDEQG